MKSWHGLVHVEHDADGQTVEKEYFLGEDLKLTDYTNEKYAHLLSLILDDYDIDLVHVDSPVGHTFDILSIPAQKNIPIICTIHDFFYICPTFHLVDNKGDFCNICNQGEEKNSCLGNHEYLYSKFDSDDLIEFRAKFRSIISNVDTFVFPSNSTKEIFSKYYDINESVCRMIYHGTSLVKKKTVLPVRSNRNFRVGILGSMLKHKGRASITAIMKALEGHPVEFVHFGDGDLSGGNLTNLGRYDQSNILHLLQSEQIDVILLLSTWPETFSYTLTETIAANIPPIVTNMGALAERVSADDIGWLVDYKDVAGIADLLLRLSADNSEVEKYKKRICKVGLKTLSEMSREYEQLYESILADSKYENHKIHGWPGEEIASGNDDGFFGGNTLRLKMIKVNSIAYRIKTKAISFFCQVMT
jgi:glycosyltransferase involved in cell wall biosynthesis